MQFTTVECYDLNGERLAPTRGRLDAEKDPTIGTKIAHFSKREQLRELIEASRRRKPLEDNTPVANQTPREVSMKRNTSVCYVDDDPDDVRRFRTLMQDRYTVGAGHTLPDALGELKQRRIKRPDIFLLDLYYGPNTDDEKHAEIAESYEELSKKVKELRSSWFRLVNHPTVVSILSIKSDRSTRVFR